MHLRDLQQRSPIFTVWERTRNSPQVHWAMECFAEMLGVFLYTYLGVGCTAAWTFGNFIKAEGLSNLPQIGFAYAAGVIFAIIVCSATSGGHFSPCITIILTLFKGFSKTKAVRYILAQILGSYLACCLVYCQWRPFIQIMETALLQAGKATYDKTMFTPTGPAGIFAFYLLPSQTIGYAFLNEFVNCVILAVIVWACLDPTSYFIPPTLAPLMIGLAYASIIWGFAVPGLALNTARDVGSRLWVLTIWGSQAAGGGYAAVTALTNIPATLLGVFLYEFFLTDSDRVVANPHLEYLQHVAGHRRLGQYPTGSESEIDETKYPNAA